MLLVLVQKNEAVRFLGAPGNTDEAASVLEGFHFQQHRCKNVKCQ
jgi:hypothetical protein